jgi:electron-transferring-flavoprotein dehydrogenase
VDVRAKVTIFCDGVRGNPHEDARAKTRAGQACRRSTRSGSKELWEVPQDRLAGRDVMHTMGYPLQHRGVRRRVHLRHAGRARALVGFVGLDYTIRCSTRTSRSSGSSSIRFMSSLLAGGKLVRYGAKALPEGGWHTIPRRAHGRRADRG